jgi:hypothetical protein
MRMLLKGMFACILAALPLLAQGPRQPIYDAAKEVTIQGDVENVTSAARGSMSGTRLSVKSGEESLEVLLGPSSFIESKGFTFSKGDRVEITGSKISAGRLIAREIVKNQHTLTLRDKSGRPMWARRRRR